MKTPRASLLLGSLLFALAMLASAWLLRGTPASVPVQTALTGAALCFLIFRRPACAPRTH